MTEGAPRAVVCAGCGTQLGTGFLACPACGGLLYADQLKAAAAEAEAAVTAGDDSAALAAWRRALSLLPPDYRQYQSVAARIDTISRRLPPGSLGGVKSTQSASAKNAPSWAKRAGPLGALGMLAWKFKFFLTLLLSQGKLLLLGLTKAGTFFSMLLSMGVYWTIFGWKFALGFIASIYVHEMGHVAALRRYGIPASAPMFIPGFGAIVRLKQYPMNPTEDAAVGLAGPIWGLAAALVSYALFYLTGRPIFAALAHAGAFINLFNLIPVWQLDGSRGFNALDRKQRFLIVGAIAIAWVLSQEGMLALVGLAAFLRALAKDAPATGNRNTLITFALLVWVLAALSRIAVAGTP